MAKKVLTRQDINNLVEGCYTEDLNKAALYGEVVSFAGLWTDPTNSVSKLPYTNNQAVLDGDVLKSSGEGIRLYGNNIGSAATTATFTIDADAGITDIVKVYVYQGATDVTDRASINGNTLTVTGLSVNTSTASSVTIRAQVKGLNSQSTEVFSNEATIEQARAAYHGYIDVQITGERSVPASTTSATFTIIYSGLQAGSVITLAGTNCTPPEDITVSEGSGEIEAEVTFSKYTGTGSRNIVLSATGTGEDTATVSDSDYYTQQESRSVIEVSAYTDFVSSAATSQTLDIIYTECYGPVNLGFSINITGQSKTSFTATGTGRETITVSFTANPGQNERTFTVSATGTGEVEEEVYGSDTFKQRAQHVIPTGIYISDYDGNYVHNYMSGATFISVSGGTANAYLYFENTTLTDASVKMRLSGAAEEETLQYTTAHTRGGQGYADYITISAEIPANPNDEPREIFFSVTGTAQTGGTRVARGFFGQDGDVYTFTATAGTPVEATATTSTVEITEYQNVGSIGFSAGVNIISCTKIDDTHYTLTYLPNESASQSRDIVATFSGRTGGGRAVYATATITQNPDGRFITLSPAVENVESTATTALFTLRCKGFPGETIVIATDPGSSVSPMSFVPVSDDASTALTVSFAKNTDTAATRTYSVSAYNGDEAFIATAVVNQAVASATSLDIVYTGSGVLQPSGTTSDFSVTATNVSNLIYSVDNGARISSTNPLAVEYPANQTNNSVVYTVRVTGTDIYDRTLTASTTFTQQSDVFTFAISAPDVDTDVTANTVTVTATNVSNIGYSAGTGITGYSGYQVMFNANDSYSENKTYEVTYSGETAGGRMVTASTTFIQSAKTAELELSPSTQIVQSTDTGATIQVISVGLAGVVITLSAQNGSYFDTAHTLSSTTVTPTAETSADNVAVYFDQNPDPNTNIRYGISAAATSKMGLSLTASAEINQGSGAVPVLTITYTGSNRSALAGNTGDFVIYASNIDITGLTYDVDNGATVAAGTPPTSITVSYPANTGASEVVYTVTVSGTDIYGAVRTASTTFRQNVLSYVFEVIAPESPAYWMDTQTSFGYSYDSGIRANTIGWVPAESTNVTAATIMGDPEYQVTAEHTPNDTGVDRQIKLCLSALTVVGNTVYASAATTQTVSNPSKISVEPDDVGITPQTTAVTYTVTWSFMKANTVINLAGSNISNITPASIVVSEFTDAPISATVNANCTANQSDNQRVLVLSATTTDQTGGTISDTGWYVQSADSYDFTISANPVGPDSTANTITVVSNNVSNIGYSGGTGITGHGSNEVYFPANEDETAKTYTVVYSGLTRAGRTVTAATTFTQEADTYTFAIAAPDVSTDATANTISVTSVNVSEIGYHAGTGITGHEGNEVRFPENTGDTDVTYTVEYTGKTRAGRTVTATTTFMQEADSYEFSISAPDVDTDVTANTVTVTATNVSNIGYSAGTGITDHKGNEVYFLKNTGDTDATYTVVYSGLTRGGRTVTASTTFTQSADTYTFLINGSPKNVSADNTASTFNLSASNVGSIGWNGVVSDGITACTVNGSNVNVEYTMNTGSVSAQKSFTITGLTRGGRTVSTGGVVNQQISTSRLDVSADSPTASSATTAFTFTVSWTGVSNTINLVSENGGIVGGTGITPGSSAGSQSITVTSTTNPGQTTRDIILSAATLGMVGETLTDSAKTVQDAASYNPSLDWSVTGITVPAYSSSGPITTAVSYTYVDITPSTVGISNISGDGITAVISTAATSVTITVSANRTDSAVTKGYVTITGTGLDGLVYDDTLEINQNAGVDVWLLVNGGQDTAVTVAEGAVYEYPITWQHVALNTIGLYSSSVTGVDAAEVKTGSFMNKTLSLTAGTPLMISRDYENSFVITGTSVYGDTVYAPFTFTQTGISPDKFYTAADGISGPLPQTSGILPIKVVYTGISTGETITLSTGNGITGFTENTGLTDSSGVFRTEAYYTANAGSTERTLTWTASCSGKPASGSIKQAGPNDLTLSVQVSPDNSNYSAVTAVDYTDAIWSTNTLYIKIEHSKAQSVEVRWRSKDCGMPNGMHVENGATPSDIYPNMDNTLVPTSQDGYIILSADITEERRSGSMVEVAGGPFIIVARNANGNVTASINFTRSGNI